MIRLRSLLPHAVVVMVAAVLAGCGSTPKTHFYTLQAPLPAGAGSSVAAAGQPGIVIGLVSLPELVDRPQLVVRTANNSVGISDLHRWGEPLKRDIAHVLAASISRELGNPRVTVHGQSGGAEGDVRIAVDVLRFESVPGVEAVIEVNWVVRRKGAEPVAGRSVAREKVQVFGYEPLVAAHSRSLEQVGREIAAAVGR